jgi:farnesyl diphosphate synthase
MSFQKKIGVYQLRVVNKLKKYLSQPSRYSSDKLHRAMMYSLFNGGKRLRPLLVYGVGSLLNANQKQLDCAAMSVECIHTFSLIHDDLPSMDDDDYRRGKLSSHKKFNESTAILAGDALQSLGFEILAANQNSDQIALLAKAIGSQGMALGQVEDMIYQEKKKRRYFKLSQKQLYEMHQLKTGKLITASVLLGALCQKTKPPQRILNKLKLFGEYFGLGFQLLDDYLDKDHGIQIDTAVEVFRKAMKILQWFENHKYQTTLLKNIIEYLLFPEKLQ